MTDEPLTTRADCILHTKHMPNSHLNDVHHIWPLGDGGPNIAENRIVVCPTGHRNIHQLLKEYKVSRGTLPWSVLRAYSVEERHYAQLGYERITRGSM